jgi:hypothetical protein
LVAGNPRDRSLQHRLVLEEVQMTPLLLLDVVDAASFGPAGRTGEPTAAREADVQVELLPLGIEFGPQHDPWGRKGQRGMEKFGVSHPSMLPDSRTCQIPPQPAVAPLPTRNGDEPNMMRKI